MIAGRISGRKKQRLRRRVMQEALLSFQASRCAGDKIIDSAIHRFAGESGQRLNDSIKQLLMAYGVTWLGLGGIELPLWLLLP
jgi:hypothetical protein